MKKFFKSLVSFFLIFLMASFIAPQTQAKSLRFRHSSYQQNLTTLTSEQNTQAQSAITTITPAVVSIFGKKNISPTLGQSTVQEIDLPFMRIYITTPQITQAQTSAGSGFIVRQDGYIVTASHVVDDPDSTYTVVTSDGLQKQAQIIYKNPENDVAIIKINGENYPTANLGDSSNLETGQIVMGIGNALGQSQMVTSFGAVTNLNRTISPENQDGSSQTIKNLFQSNMQLYPGDSGGPTFDINGSVIGINDAIALGRSNISFSVPINLAKTALDQILN